MTSSVNDIIQVARSIVNCVDASTAINMHKKGDGKFIDVREASELAQNGTIPGAINIPRSNLEWLIDPSTSNFPYKVSDRLVFFCGGGGRSVLSAQRAREMGYTDVLSVDGGFRGWLAASGPVTAG